MGKIDFAKKNFMKSLLQKISGEGVVGLTFAI